MVRFGLFMLERAVARDPCRDRFERAFEIRSAAGGSLNLAAGRAANLTRPQQHDRVRLNLVVRRDARVDRSHDLIGIGLAMGTLHLMCDDESLGAVPFNCKRRAHAAVQSGMAGLYRLLDVMRIVLDSADDDQILNAPGDEQLAVAVKAAKVTGSKVGTAIAVRESCSECGERLIRLIPIPLRNAAAGDPDLADAVNGQFAAGFRIDNHHVMAGPGPAASHQRLEALWVPVRRSQTIVSQR